MSSLGNGGVIGVPITVVTTETTSEAVTSFTSPGTFTAQTNQITATVLLVAGGGSGGSAAANNAGAGGGGGGGFRIIENHPIPAAGVAVTIGAGGSAPNGNGTNSIFGSSVPIASTGGGSGRTLPHGAPADSGQPGGSAGGGSDPARSGGNAGGYSPPEGNVGGVAGGAPLYAGGGGGGAGGVGGDGPAHPSNGGTGSPSTVGSPTASPSSNYIFCRR